MKISFNFAGTLSEETQQKIAADFIKSGHEVWITAPRNLTDDNVDIFDVAEKLGIPQTQIQLTGERDKFQFLREFDLHFDNEQPVVDSINGQSSDCVAILVNEPVKPPDTVVE
jgi:hypothetical protein